MRATPVLAEVLDVGFLEVLGGLEFEVGDLEAGGGGLGEDFELGGEVAGELAAVGCASTGGDRGDGGIVAEELLELGQRGEGIVQVVEAELKEGGGVLDDGCGFFEHLGWGVANDGDTDSCRCAGGGTAGLL